jgi:DNA-binding Xre family transcriptional regulator
MRRQTNWDRYYKRQMDDPLTRRFVEEELGALRIGIQVAKLRQEKGLSQTQLAARVGMSAPNISRIETDPSSNLTLNTLVKLFRALDREVAIVTRPRRRKPRAKSA